MHESFGRPHDHQIKFHPRFSVRFEYYGHPTVTLPLARAEKGDERLAQGTKSLSAEDPSPPLPGSDISLVNPAPRKTNLEMCFFFATKGILLTPKTTITERGGTRAEEGKLNMSPVEVLVNLWRHECERVFCDKLTTNKVRTFCFYNTASGHD